MAETKQAVAELKPSEIPQPPASPIKIPTWPAWGILATLMVTSFIGLVIENFVSDTKVIWLTILIIFMAKDYTNLKKAGFRPPSRIWIILGIIPVYLFKRCNLLHMSKRIFWVSIGIYGLFFFVADTLEPSESLSENANSSSGIGGSIQNNIVQSISSKVTSDPAITVVNDILNENFSGVDECVGIQRDQVIGNQQWRGWAMLKNGNCIPVIINESDNMVGARFPYKYNSLNYEISTDGSTINELLDELAKVFADVSSKATYPIDFQIKASYQMTMVLDAGHDASAVLNKISGMNSIDRANFEFLRQQCANMGLDYDHLFKFGVDCSESSEMRRLYEATPDREFIADYLFGENNLIRGAIPTNNE